MDLKATGHLVRLLIGTLIMLIGSVLRVYIDMKSGMPFIIGFVSFLLCLIFVGLAVVILFDLIGKQKATYTGRVINREGKIIHVLRTDHKLKKYRINAPEVLDRLEADQQVEIAMTRLSRIPARITILDNGAKDTCG